MVLTLSSLNLPLSSHPLQAANCYRNSRLGVDEDDLKCVINGKKLLRLSKQFQEVFRSKTPKCRKLCYSSDMQNYALMHREGLKG